MMARMDVLAIYHTSSEGSKTAPVPSSDPSVISVLGSSFPSAWHRHLLLLKLAWRGLAAAGCALAVPRARTRRAGDLLDGQGTCRLRHWVSGRTRFAPGTAVSIASSRIAL